jgi:uroporphyrinogen decarboxylase
MPRRYACDFGELATVLRRGRPSRPVLFEFFLNRTLFAMLLEGVRLPDDETLRPHAERALAFHRAGYDHACLAPLPGFDFVVPGRRKQASLSLNEGGLISDRESFERYAWPDLAAVDLGLLDRLSPWVPEGMRLVPHGPCGVEENAIRIVGYDRLCYLMADDPELAQALFDRIGEALVGYYRLVCPHPLVGAAISNDDWGFKTQPLLTPSQMARYVFPWHKRIVEAIHASGKPAILHSCGAIYPWMDTVIDSLGFDAKHSFEDAIMPVEAAYERYAGRIAILGGIDVDFVIRRSPEEVYRRSAAMLERSRGRGGYALGTGNSVPEYVPPEHYFAMTRAALPDPGVPAGPE